MPKAPNLIGQTFGMLTVHSRAKSNKYGVRWLCVCVCGGTATPTTNNLKSGNSTSCGCRKYSVLGASTRTHGLHSTPEYSVWKSIRQRCYNPRSASYKNYGGRGIGMSEAWRSSFQQFYLDMGPRPLGMTIERRDNDGDYTKENCVWATRAQQARNKSGVRKVSVRGLSMCVVDWAAYLGTTTSILYWRARTRPMETVIAELSANMEV